jgi:ATP-dependent DNA helicase RecQ
MGEEKAHRIRTILDFLIKEGCLLTEGDEYPVVCLGEGIEEILKEERRLFMKLPKEQKPHASSLKLQPVSRKSVSVHSEPTPQYINKNIDTNDVVLFEKLKDLRKKIATEENVPAYVVFSNASLLDMCHRKPTSLVQFSAVNGVGAVKLEKYGETFVEAIKSMN